MIDTSKAKWDFDYNEKYAIKYWDNNGYSGELKRQYVTKTVFVIRKDGTELQWAIYSVTKPRDMKKCMEQFEFAFNLHRDLEELREEVKA